LRNLIEWLCDERTAASTLRQMHNYIEEKMGRAPCKSTLAVWLENELLLITKTRPQITSASELPRMLDDRAAYAFWRGNNLSSNVVYVSMHNVVLSARTARVVCTNFSTVARTTAFVAVSPVLGAICCQCRPSEQFEDFLDSTLSAWRLKGVPGHMIVITDEALLNTAAYQRMWGDFLKKSGSGSWLLPRHSAMLNPLEPIVQEHKGYIREQFLQRRADLVRKHETLRSQNKGTADGDHRLGNDEEAEISPELTEFYQSTLNSIVSDAWGCVTSEALDRHCRRVEILIPKCLERQLIELFDTQ